MAVDFNLNIKLTPKQIKKFAEQAQEELNKKLQNFFKILLGKRLILARGIAQELRKAPVVDFLQKDGVAQLGITHPDQVLSNLFTVIGTNVEINASDKDISIQIGKIDAIRRFTSFVWSSLKGDKTVNLWSLIENEPISSADWTGTGTDGFAFIPTSDAATERAQTFRDVSRTGRGLMISIDKINKGAYKLPSEHINGFSEYFKSDNPTVLLDIFEKVFVSSLRAAGFKVKGKLFKRIT